MIYVLAVSDGYKHFGKAISEYEKRLGKKIHIQKIKPSKKTNIDEIRSQEATSINKALEKIKSKEVILLSEWGTTHDSPTFAKDLHQKSSISKNLVYIVGGSYGVSPDDILCAHELLSFGKSTMPHGLALLVLVEQIYRAYMIEKGTSYHH